MRTSEEILKDRLEANGYEWEHIRMWADIKPYLPIIYSAMFHHSVEYMKEMRQQKRGLYASLKEQERQNTLLAQKCSDYADLVTNLEDRIAEKVKQLVAMTLERDEFDEANKKLVGELRSYKQWFKEREESMKRMEQEIKVLETKIQFLEPYKELYEDYKARYEFEENPPEVEEIFVTSSCPEDVYAAFTDKARAQWDAKESGTEVCSIKLHRGPKAIFNDNEKDY